MKLPQRHIKLCIEKWTGGRETYHDGDNDDKYDYVDRGRPVYNDMTIT